MWPESVLQEGLTKNVGLKVTNQIARRENTGRENARHLVSSLRRAVLLSVEELSKYYDLSQILLKHYMYSL